MKKRRRRLLIVLLVLTLVVGGVFVYARMGLGFVVVSTGAMANTILPGDSLVVNNFFRRIDRGDIVIFKYPADQSVRYVKRVVGLPGETIHITSKRVYINGTELPERRVQVWETIEAGPLQEGPAEGEGSYSVFWRPDTDASELEITETPELFRSDNPIYEFAVTEPFVIPDHKYFVMGDNRDNSQDSRVYGPVDGSLIVGKVVLIYWSETTSQESARDIRWSRIFTKPR
jgi:signal peptidase I